MRRNAEMTSSMRRGMTFAVAMLGAALMGGASAGAQSAASQKAAVQQAMRAMFGVHEIEEAAITPDGTRVAWVEALGGKNGAPSANKAIYVADWKAPEGRVQVSRSEER